MDVSLIRAKQLLQYSRMDDMSACSEDNTEALTKLYLCFFRCKQGFYTIFYFCFVSWGQGVSSYNIKLNENKLMSLKRSYYAILTIQKKSLKPSFRELTLLWLDQSVVIGLLLTALCRKLNTHYHIWWGICLTSPDQTEKKKKKNMSHLIRLLEKVLTAVWTNRRIYGLLS